MTDLQEAERIAKQERDTIVAWLRAGVDSYPHGTYARCREMQSYWDAAADAIERGDHLSAVRQVLERQS